MRVPSKPKIVLAVAFLAVLAVEEVRRFPFRQLPADLAATARLFAGRRARATSPEYAAFLDGILRETPPEAVVQVFAPKGTDLLRAQYELAPRRVVGEEWRGRSDFAAFYGSDRAPVGPSIQIPGGLLQRQ